MEYRECFNCGGVFSLDCFALKRGKPSSQCKTCKYQRAKEYREVNKEQIKLKNSRYWETTKGTDAQKARNSQKCATYRQKHPALFCHYAAKYRVQKVQATPPWETDARIKSFYLGCPKGYHVDHIIPLRGDVVSGLHVVENLQYLPARENLQKSNKYTV